MHTTGLTTINHDLEAGKTIVIDAGTGTELERRGADMHAKAWCAMATQTAPQLLHDIHLDYIHAGARVITANTFSSNRAMLEPAGLAANFESLNRRAVEIACQARTTSGQIDRVAVAGSISHQVPVLPGVDQRDTRAVPPTAVSENNYREMAQLLAASGVDFLLLEMMSDPDLANPAITAALATGLPVWVGFSVRMDSNGALQSYARPDLSAHQMLSEIAVDGAQAIGVMHSKLNTISATIDLIKERWAGPLMIYPDSGYFKMPHWQFVDVMATDEFVGHAQAWRTCGVQIIGGCCGLGVEHIQALTDSL